MRSVMSSRFGQIPDADIPRSAFDLSRGYKTTFDAGLLIPIFRDEVLPGDTWNVRMQGFARMATPIHPIMDNIFMDTHFFFVPNRLIWDNWQKFNGEQENPDDSTDFLVPTLSSGTSTGFAEQSIHDYLGLPTKVPGLDVCAFWHRAYNLIYNEWFRDQNMVDSVIEHKGDGPDPRDDYRILRRGKRHDYFTSCLPFAQKGESVGLPLGDTAPVVPNAPDARPEFIIPGLELRSQATTGVVTLDTPTQFLRDMPWSDPNLHADLAAATAATVNQLRQAFQVQKLFERDARGGTRYIEIIRAHFNVVSPDQRLQRPEFLGGGTSMVNVTPVPQTSETSAITPQGNLSAYGTANLNGHGFIKSFTEHGVLVGLASVRADLTYQQGIPRMFSRQTRFDFYWPALAQIGEQAVLRKEIYAVGSADPTQDEEVFGYQERHAEYRYGQSQVTGLFRTNADQSLDAWHLSQFFQNLPRLNEEFIQEVPPIDRVIAVQDEPHFIFDSHFAVRAVRPMPMFGVPGFIDHF